MSTPPDKESVTPPMAEPVLIESSPIEGCTLLKLNRPRVKNALNHALRESLFEAFTRLAGQESARVLILTGAGDAFCAGLDLKELGAGSAAAGDAVTGASGRRPSSDPMAAMRAFPGPIIGAVNGVAITGGFEIALNCDVLLASPNARFADTHGRVGIMPGWGLSQLLPRTIGLFRAKELSLTGNFLDAARAEAWGLVNRVLPAEQLIDQTLALAADMLTLQPAMLPAYKKLIDDGYGLAYADARTLERNRGREHWQGLAARSIEEARHSVRDRGRQQIRPGSGEAA